MEVEGVSAEQSPIMSASSRLTEKAVEVDCKKDPNVRDIERIQSYHAAKEHEDKYELITKITQDIDTLVTFAALFTAIVIAFSFESYKALQAVRDSDGSELQVSATQRSQNALTDNETLLWSWNPSPIQSHISATRTNILWFSSLVCSLAAACLAILVKKLLLVYHVRERTVSENYSSVRSLPLEGSLRWRALLRIAALLPIILQISLLLFSLGLINLLWSLYPEIGWLITALVACWLVLILVFLRALLLSQISYGLLYINEGMHTVQGCLSRFRYGTPREGNSFLDVEKGIPANMDGDKMVGILRSGQTYCGKQELDDVKLPPPAYLPPTSSGSSGAAAQNQPLSFAIHKALEGLPIDFTDRDILSLRDNDAGEVLELLHRALSDSFKYNLSIEEEAYRRTVRRLLVTLSRNSGVIPPFLFLDGVTQHDREPLSQGHFAEVFRAFHNGRAVALKRLRVNLSTRDGNENMKAFCREALLWSQLRHPFVQPLLGVDRDTFAPRHCMVSPWMKHGNVHACMDLLEKNGVAIPFDRWLEEIARGVEYLHEEQIVHGDLRGANVLIDDDLHVRLVDFGLTRFADASSSSLGSHPGGSARWMAPELLYYTISPTYATDAYSFGCLSVEIYTRRPPFAHIRNEVQVMAQVTLRGARPTRPLETGKVMSDDLWLLVQHCWATDAESRPTFVAISSVLSQLRLRSLMR